MEQTELGEKILELREQGLTYNQIKDKLNCSKSTISYYCSEGGAERAKKKVKEYKEENSYWRLIKKLDNFKRDRYKYRKQINQIMCKDWKKKMSTACSRFRLRNKNIETMEYTYKDAINHLGGEVTKCYLTGRAIDITKDDFNLDHIIPASRGGSCELTNMGITIPEVNSMKSNLLVEELLDLCKEVLEYNGYSVTK